MKTIALLDADLVTTPLGTRSRLAESLAGVPILRRTVDRVGRCGQVERIVVTCPPDQHAAITDLLAGTRVDVRPQPAGPPAYRRLVRAARKWSLDAWRGGLGGSSHFDEYFDVTCAAALLQELDADQVAVIPPGAAVLDPELATRMIEHSIERADEVRLTFAPAPPGLLPALFRRPLVDQLAKNGVPPGWSIAYKPDQPMIDLAFKPSCFQVSQSIRYAAGRLTADTDRSMDRLNALSQHGDLSAAQIGDFLIREQDCNPGRLPREVEIELTTSDPVNATLVRPRGALVPDRGEIDPRLVERVAAELAGFDDSLVVLGGFGDPLLHHDFARVLAHLRQAGVYGIALTTTGQHLPDAALQAILDHQVDVVVVQLDAWSAETYRQIHGGPELSTVQANIQRLVDARMAALQAEPVIVPQFTKCTVNVDELDAFFDGWIRRQGCASIIGYSTYAGSRPDLRVTDTAPPTRLACRRLMNRCLILADGTVAACDQDPSGRLALGHVGSRHLEPATLGEVWAGERARRLRAAHAAQALDNEPRCMACSEWHRP